MQRRGSHLKSLTSLRFFAGAAVLLKHGAVMLAPAQIWSTVFQLGYVGVSFFFVLSGFVLAWSYNPNLAVPHFYGRRVARIYPLHLATAAVAAALLVYSGDAVALLPALANLVLLQAWIPAQPYGEALNAVSWSLSCEAFFYAMFPLVIGPLAAARHPLRIGVAVVIATILAMLLAHATLPPLVAGQIVYQNPLIRFGEFVIGILLAANVRRLPRVNSIPLAAAVFAASLLLTFVVSRLLSKTTTPVGPDFADMLMLPATILLIVAAANSDLSGKASFLQSRRMVLLGKASFALYMIHQLMLHFVVLTFGRSYAAWLLTSLGAIGVSIVVFKWFEEPIESWLRARIGRPRRSTIAA